jgi:hypothetical protein
MKQGEGDEVTEKEELKRLWTRRKDERQGNGAISP